MSNSLFAQNLSEGSFDVSSPVEVGDKSYTLFRADSPFSIDASNTKNYVVKEHSDGAVLLEEYFGNIDADVLVIIESASFSASVNPLDLITRGTASSGNKLSGINLDNDNLVGSFNIPKDFSHQEFGRSTHRILAVSKSGSLIFTKPSISKLPSNSAYLEVSTSAKESLAVFFDKREYDEYNDDLLDKSGDSVSQSDVYNLLGKKVPNSGNLPAGIYIIGGKKTVIR